MLVVCVLVWWGTGWGWGVRGSVLLCCALVEVKVDIDPMMWVRVYGPAVQVMCSGLWNASR